MSLNTGTHTLGPDSVNLVVRTGREGKAAIAGHNLEIRVDDWSATLEIGDTPEATRLELTVNSHSLRVLTGHGGVQSLDDGDRTTISKTIDDDILKGRPIEFRSTRVHPGEAEGTLHVHGDLNLLGTTRPIAFSLVIDEDGRLSAEAAVVQTEFGIKPYTTLFGTLKVKDEVTVAVEGTIPEA